MPPLKTGHLCQNGEGMLHGGRMTTRKGHLLWDLAGILNFDAKK